MDNGYEAEIYHTLLSCRKAFKGESSDSSNHIFMTEIGRYKPSNRHVNVTKLYLHFGSFAGDAILWSNFSYFLLFLFVLFFQKDT